MKLNKLAISAASLMLALAFMACSLAGLGGGSSTPRPGEPTSTPDPRIPTNTDGAETIVIPGGTFWMGSDEADTQADEDELPRHQVTLGTFPIYTHEVTNEMYARCVEAGACIPVQVLEGGPTSHYDDASFAEHPVVGVDWNMADDYCTWAGARLPTEAEWEYAARGTESLLYPWGTGEPACDRVNMYGCLHRPDTVKVGSYELGNSPFGVWDLSGNVWEWTHDWYDPDYYTLSPSSSPLGPNLPDDRENPQKVVRGGGMNSEPAAMRSAGRVGARPLRAFDDVGFRCVAQAGLDLPVGYAGVPDVHEIVPPDSLDGGGEHVEEPGAGPWYSQGHTWATCPDEAGRMHVSFEVDSYTEVEYSVEIEGNAFDCTYDEALRRLECDGPVPENNAELDRYSFILWWDHSAVWHAFIPKPTGCLSGVAFAPIISATASCPDEGGFVTITITASTTMEIDWDTTQLIDGAMDMDIPCWPLGGGDYRCLVPAREPGDSYYIYLHGFMDNGGELFEGVTATIPGGCPVGFYTEEVSTLCHEGHQALEVNYSPTTRDLASVTDIGIPLSCITAAPGVEVCGELMGTPGSDATVAVCFADEGCTDWTVTVPDCSEIPSYIPWDEFYTYFIESYCATGGHFVGPAIWSRYHPGDSPVASATSEGVELSCFQVATDWFCGVLPGAPGSDTTATICLENGTCFSEEITVPDYCEEADSPPAEEWSFAGLGCHDESQIFFIVDTGMDWLVPGSGLDSFASDGDTEYSCSIHPTVAYSLYCSGERPDAPGPLEVCVERHGMVSSYICDSFDDWPAQVAAIPDCAPPGEPACSSYSDQVACVNHGCTWQNPPLPMGCFPTQP